MAGLLLGTCCHGLVPRPGNMPQQWSSHGPVILFSIDIPFCNMFPAVAHPKPSHSIHYL
ncbi:hypothetical protein PAXINDRAFT_21535 [Paxillus involutus ATCC 200175]|uniref:Unplaced genomic scaffold PAXINscaffold_1853, whole genome shotgun sequence n=1 Tax=Paxillus involutus ATCC 200175 TaxID=664439 RepID=A0A0C9TAI1_PAXIN|nr:hypothetical protein PAXINDRAFT_21535 [Paxillus involutus ATCC 200175]